jgi:hypothetical protein
METAEIGARVLAAGLGGTLAMDGWGLAQKRLLGAAAPDYALVGRWLGHMRQGRLRHAAITGATPVRGERAIGWAAHYAIGIAFAALPPLLWGAGWLQAPTPAPALLVGLATVAAPFLVMQPAFGLGVAAAKTPRPWGARRRSLANHLMFGVGLYLGALLAARF